jgi:hypothetical protein
MQREPSVASVVAFRYGMVMKKPWINDVRVSDIFTENAIADLRTKLRQHSLTVDNLWRQADKTTEHRFLASCGFYIGMACSAIGFIFWVFRVQKRQDILEDLQIKKAQKELEQAPQSPPAASSEAPKQ